MLDTGQINAADTSANDAVGQVRKVEEVTFDEECLVAVAWIGCTTCNVVALDAVAPTWMDMWGRSGSGQWDGTEEH